MIRLWKQQLSLSLQNSASRLQSLIHFFTKVGDWFCDIKRDFKVFFITKITFITGICFAFPMAPDLCEFGGELKDYIFHLLPSSKLFCRVSKHWTVFLPSIINTLWVPLKYRLSCFLLRIFETKSVEESSRNVSPSLTAKMYLVRF